MSKGVKTESADFLEGLLGPATSPLDPGEAAKRGAKRVLPKRFWRDVGITSHLDGFALTLDGKLVRTPGRHVLAVPNAVLAEALATEWRAMEVSIDPAKMPLTRLVYAALDCVARTPLPVAREIVKYAGSDLLCYREAENQRLAARQAEHWDPALAHMRDAFGIRFNLGAGVMFVEQESDAMEAVRRAVSHVPAPFGLAALHAVTTLTGSAILGLALANGRLSPDEVWAAAHVDEDFQIEAWGEDAEAAARRAARRAEFDAAALMLATLR
ncbi:MAG: ATPase [Hyphomicrobiales bacterium]|nr:ATPase [Hyphomicrobiales bacterium]MBV9739132.1 ATPase [Hyphomicrobiales bacterium]